MVKKNKMRKEEKNGKIEKNKWNVKKIQST